MGEKKPKVCKCGHSRDLHVKYKKFPIPTNCQSCPCTDYMNRKRPDIADKASVYLGIGFSGFMIFTVSSLFYDFQGLLEKQLTIPMTVGTAIWLILGLTLILICIFTSNLIIPYFAAKNRKTYPEQT